MPTGIKCYRSILNLLTVIGKRCTSTGETVNVFSNTGRRFIQVDGTQNVNQFDIYRVSKREFKCRFSTEASKLLLHNIYDTVCRELGSNKWKPSFHCVPLIENSQTLWKAKLTLHWPTTFIEEGIASRKKIAEAIAAKKAIEWLLQQNVLDKRGHPIMSTTEEKPASMQKRNEAYYTINLKPDLEESLENLLNEYREIEAKLSSCQDKLTWEPRFAEENEVLSDDISSVSEVSVCSDLIDIITGEKYKETEPEILSSRSFSMYCEMKEKETRLDYCKMKEQRDLLPITRRREDILFLIRNNPVIVLSGETGCGKTTQVPQFVLNDYIYSMMGSSCNMVVTQPRRISAISIANRVAKERCERLGATIGFQVRLDKLLPKEKGAVLFCTTGILLRRLQSNPYLEGISHVIVDEVHERSIQIDFLLTLLKKALEKNKRIKLILMSATINAELFSTYFDNCPIINISGFTYPVKQFFLEDVYSMLNREKYIQSGSPEVDVDIDLVTDVICKVDSTRPDGAILCFLPGWQEIKATKEKLLKSSYNQSRFDVYPLHSVLSQHKQAQVFEPASTGKRKVILATNIAETSITINDVVYVIDSGCHKELMYSSDKGISILSTNCISKANVQQRKGRAGRVLPGECFHLFEKEDMDNMLEFPIPEMLRASLENVVLDTKIYCPEEAAVNFLAQTLQPPPIKNVQQAVQDLQVLDILDNEEKLTTLGRRVIYFSIHPRLSKAVIYSVIFRCLDPMLTIAAMLSANRNPFDVGIEGQADVREIKKKYKTSYPSDPLSFANLFKEWNSITSQEQTVEFCQENMLSLQSMKFIKGLKELLLEHLVEAKLISKVDKSSMDLLAVYNEYSSNEFMPLSVISNAFYPNVLRIKHGKINQKKSRFCTLNGKNARIPSDSICKTIEYPSKFVVSFTAVGSQKGSTVVKESSIIPELAVLLCMGRDVLMIHNDETGNSVLIIDGKKNLTFASSKEQCEMLMELRICFNKVVQWSLCSSGENVKDDTVNEFIDKFMKTFVKLLSPHVKSTTLEDNLNEFVNKSSVKC